MPRVMPKRHGAEPFHGYYFKILTRQGRLRRRKNELYEPRQLNRGICLVAYPDSDHSGIMTFIVNQDGKVYQRNLAKNFPDRRGDKRV